MKILKKSFLSYEKSLITRSSRAPFLNFFEKKETYLDPNRKKIRKSKLSDYLVPGLVVLSWVFIFKIWWGAEEVCRKQYESLAKEDASAYRTVFENKELRKNEIPEEYRSEYVKKYCFLISFY
jgi:hypothetical protein